jgi:hypothetical protein
MNRSRVPLAVTLACLPLATTACGGGSGSSPSVTCTNGTIVANETNNYTFSSTLTLPPVKVKPGSDLTFDWSGLTTDFLGQPVHQTDLTAIFLLLVDLKAEDFEAQLNDDSFASSSIIIPGPPPNFVPTPGVTMINLYNNFQSANGPVDMAMAAQYLDAAMYTPANSTFAIVAQSGTDIGNGIRMIQSFELDPSSTNTTVKLTNTSTVLHYTANLHNLHPTGVPAATPAMTLDWGQMTKTAMGADFIKTNIASAIIGHYTQSLGTLESQFLDLRTIASDLYTIDIPSGTVLDFSMAKDSAGNPFPGIDANGTWMVGLICTYACRNPAPWYLTVLEPVPQPCPASP